MTDAIVTQANATYRDYIVDGVPSSLPHNPSKSDIRSLWLTLGGILDGLSGGGSGGSYVGFTTLALLNANLAYPANTVGEVIADSTPSNNGIYLKSGASGSGSWTLVSGFTLSGLNAAIAAETTRAEAAESLLAPQASPALTGTPTAPTAALGTNTTQIATTAFAGAAAGAAALAYAYVLSPSIGYFQGFPVEEAVISSNGQILSITTTAGTFFSDGNGQFVGNTVDATGIASSVGFFAGDSVISASVDQQGELLEVKTRTSDFRRGPSGLAPVGPRATQHDAPALAPTSINATACVVGVSYTILTVGTTNFTLIGAPANTVGLVFVATGAGTGTGTVTSNRYIGVGVQNDPVTNIILFLGQSNAAGNGDSADPNCAITTGALTSIFPNFALMPSTGVRLPVLGSTGNAPAPLTPIFTSLANLVESADSGNQLFETAASGCVNQLISALSTASGGVATTVAAMVAAHGSWSLAQLSRGTPVYNWMLQGLRDMCSAIFASGRRPVVIWADYNQPETDASNNTDSALYAAGLVRMCRNINNDCKAITGQTEDIVMSLTASQYGESSVGYNNILLAQEKAASVEPRIKLGNSTYYLPRVSTQTIHYNSAGRDVYGIKLGDMIFQEYFGVGFRPMLPEDVWFSGAAQITIRWPYQPYVDTSGTFVTASGLPSGNLYGLAFDDGSGSPPGISSASISGVNMVLTLSATPTGTRKVLRYAQQFNSGGSASGVGPVDGARGWIRAAGAGLNNFYNSGLPVYDWARPFIKFLP